MEINYRGMWKRVPEEDWTDTKSNIVCSHLNCGQGRSFGQSPFDTALWDFLRMGTCPPNAVSISECISNSNSSPVGYKAVSLICEGECILKVFILPFKVLSFTRDLQAVNLFV